MGGVKCAPEGKCKATRKYTVIDADMKIRTEVDKLCLQYSTVSLVYLGLVC